MANALAILPANNRAEAARLGILPTSSWARMGEGPAAAEESRERAAHTGNVSDHPFGQIRQKFSPQLKRI